MHKKIVRFFKSKIQVGNTDLFSNTISILSEAKMDLVTILLGIVTLILILLYKHLNQNRGVVEKWGVPYVKPFLWFGSPPYGLHKYNHREMYVEKSKKLGKTWARYNGITPMLVTIDHEIIKEVMVKQFENFNAAVHVDPKPEECVLDFAKGKIALFVVLQCGTLY